MGWHWYLTMPPIHVYCCELWNYKFKKIFYEIRDNSMTHLHVIIFNCLVPRLTNQAKKTIKGLGDWYIKEHYTYI